MMLLAVVLPIVAALLAFSPLARGRRPSLLVATAAAHSTVVFFLWRTRPEPVLDGWIALDALGLLFLAITSLLFLMAAIYAVGYLRSERDLPEGKESVFVGSLLLFLATMTLVTVSHNFGLLWVGVEATTLATAPLIYFHRNRRSLEATWKYLLICSVGIALALLGTLFLTAAQGAVGEGGLLLPDLLRNAPNFNAIWVKAAFVSCLVGYGTKMGLAPMHNWLPDAHSESPSLVSALLSGALLNCAFLAIIRTFAVTTAAGLGPFAGNMLIGFGLTSMGVAAVFVISQPDYKRLLAYSSIEHVGILALGVGLGGLGTFASLLHSVNHSLAKAALFLTAGNVLLVYRSKNIHDVTGLLRSVPATGFLWFVGILAIVGSPPFGPFVSEFTMLRTAIDQGHPIVAGGYMFFLSVIFIGMITAALRMTQGKPSLTESVTEAKLMIVPPAILCFLVLVLGLHIPEFLQHTLADAVLAVGGR